MVRMGATASGLSQAVGANYHQSSAKHSLEHWASYNPLEVESQVSFLRAHGFNTLRTFLNFDLYEADPTGFLETLHHYAHTLATERMLFLPVLFDSFGSEPSGDLLADLASEVWIKSPALETIAQPDFMVRANLYVASVVQTVNQAIAEVGDPEVWWIADVWNEPSVASVGLWRLAELLETVRAQQNAPCTTVGFASFADNQGLLSTLADHTSLSVLSGHPYGMFADIIRTQVELATKIGDAYGGKPIFVSEVGLPGLFQYYGNVLQWLDTAQVGFTLWEAYIGRNQFRNLTGIFYPEPAAHGFASVRSSTSANALWSLATKRDPTFQTPSIAKVKTLSPQFVILAPADVDLSTGAYHELLRNHELLYGTEQYPLLDVTRPITHTLYLKLMTWTFLSLGKSFDLGPVRGAAIVGALIEFDEQYLLGNEAEAEVALIELFTLASSVMLETGAGEPTNYAPEVLDTEFRVRTSSPGTIDVHFEAVVFDVDNEELSVQVFVYDDAQGTLTELPLTPIPQTSAFQLSILGIPRTNGASYKLAVFVRDAAGAHDLLVLPVTLP